MRPREFITLLGGAAAAWPVAALAQQRHYRIGHLAIAAPTDSPPPPPANWNAFVQGLREADYAEGRNIEFEHRSAHDQPELFPRLASVVNANSGATPFQIQEMQAAALAVGQQLLVVSVGTEEEIEKAFAMMAERHVAAIVYGATLLFQVISARLVALAARHGIPAMYEWREFVVAGGLISYSTDRNEIGRQAGNYAGRILKGEKPADLPVVQSSRFELVINLKTAKALGLEIPPTLLARADEVIE